MKSRKSFPQVRDWKSIGIVFENQPIPVDGLNLWAFKWHDTHEEPVELPHPAYPNERHQLSIYEIETGGKRIRFAAAELSANVWGFYVPAEQS